MINILRILESELEARQIRGKELFDKYCRLENEFKKLQQENEILRKDLFELSQNTICQEEKKD